MLAAAKAESYDAAILTAPGLAVDAELDNDSILFAMPTLGEYFTQLAQDWTGWSGNRSWVGGALGFTARHDGLGHVTLSVELERDLHNSWRAIVPFDIDAGALAGLAHDVSNFIRGLEFNADQQPGTDAPSGPTHRA